MSNETNTVTDLAHEAMIQSIAPEIPSQKDDGILVCKSGDKECVARWIAAFSDCE